MDEHQFFLGIDTYEICCSTRAVLLENRAKKFEFFADINKRTIDSYKIFSLIGSSVDSVIIGEEFLCVNLKKSIKFLLFKDFEFENYTITHPEIGVFIF